MWFVSQGTFAGVLLLQRRWVHMSPEQGLHGIAVSAQGSRPMPWMPAASWATSGSGLRTCHGSANMKSFSKLLAYLTRAMTCHDLDSKSQASLLSQLERHAALQSSSGRPQAGSMGCTPLRAQLGHSGSGDHVCHKTRRRDELVPAPPEIPFKL